MNPFDYIIQVLSNFQLIKIFLVVYPLLLLLNYIIFKRVLNGLTVLVFTSAIVNSVIIDFYISDQITTSKLLYFIFSDFLIYIVVLFIYKHIITTVSKSAILGIMKHINDKYFWILAGWMFIGIAISFVNVSFDGTSRLTYQTDNKWFSFVRMINQIIDPVTGLILIYNLYEKNKFKLFILASFIIFGSAAAGSKSGFVFAFAEAFLIYRDLAGVKYKIKAKVYVPLVSIVIGAMFANFYFLGVDADKVFERTVHYAESTVMIYPSKNPCAVCQNQSTIGLIHRGVGRAIHDPTSLNLDNLFGFALSKEFYGENTLTGPNARIGAYSICAFPGYEIYILYLIFIVFLGFNYFLLKITAKNPNFLYLTSILLIFHAIEHFVLDYNTAMSDLSLIWVLLLFLSIKLILSLDPTKHIEKRVSVQHD